MRRALLLALFASFSASLHAAADDPLTGDWAGSIRSGSDVRRLDLHFDAGLQGSVEEPFAERTSPMSKVERTANRLSFEWQQSAFSGTIRGDRLAGEVTGGGKAELIRVTKLDPKIRDAMDGLYEWAPGNVMVIASNPRGTFYIDMVSGRTGLLFPLPNGTFAAGPSLMIPTPVEATVSVARNDRGDVTGLTWRGADGPGKQAKRIRFKREEVAFRNGDVTLSGTLVIANTPGRHPATLRIGGFGPSTRRNFLEEVYAYHGMAYLSYDKRGAGASAGDWRQVGVEELAGDAAAGVRFLRSRPDIDPGQIGLEGGSEGGWVAPLAASKAGGIASIILYAGPALSYRDELLNETEEALRQRGFAGSEVDAALDFRRRFFDRIGSGEGLTDAGWEAIQAMARAAANERWLPFLRPPERLDWPQRKLALMLRFDPQPLWETMTIPVLALYGGADRNVPAAKNVAALDAALKKAGNRDYKIITFPKADHEGLEAESGNANELPRLKRYVPGYFDTVIQWTLARVKIPR